MDRIFLLTRPNHDHIVNYLYYWADEVIWFAEKEGIRKKVFSGKDAISSNLEKFILSERPKLMFFNGHGSETVIMGHNNLPIIDAGSNINMLGGSIVYALACNTSKSLGPQAVGGAGTLAFIGYTDKFAWVYDPNRLATPLKDRRAEPFKRFSNSICISLLEGKSTGEACSKAKNLAAKLIAEYSTSESEDVNGAIRFLLFRNMELLKLDGASDAIFA